MGLMHIAVVMDAVMFLHLPVVHCIHKNLHN